MVLVTISFLLFKWPGRREAFFFLPSSFSSKDPRAGEEAAHFISHFLRNCSCGWPGSWVVVVETWWVSVWKSYLKSTLTPLLLFLPPCLPPHACTSHLEGGLARHAPCVAPRGCYLSLLLRLLSGKSFFFPTFPAAGFRHGGFRDIMDRLGATWKNGKRKSSGRALHTTAHCTGPDLPFCLHHVFVEKVGWTDHLPSLFVFTV